MSPRRAREENAMRVSSFAFGAFVAGLGFVTVCGAGVLGATGCSVTTGPCADGGGTCTTLKTQTKYTGQNAFNAQATYDSKQIVIENANGNLTVVAGSDNNITATATPFAFADNETDAQGAMADMALTIDETSLPGKIHVQCTMPKSAHGSASAATAGCDNMKVTVPAGSVAAPIDLIITAHNGSASGSGFTGATILHSDNGDASLRITPGQGKAVESSTGNGQASLALPANFAADKIKIEADNGKLTSSFSDVTISTTSRGAAGTGASSVVLLSNNGDLTLTSF
jgi:hypothetical protein